MRMGFIPQDVISPENGHVGNNAQLIEQRRTDQERRKKWRARREQRRRQNEEEQPTTRPSQTEWNGEAQPMTQTLHGL